MLLVNDLAESTELVQREEGCDSLSSTGVTDWVYFQHQKTYWHYCEEDKWVDKHFAKIVKERVSV